MDIKVLYAEDAKSSGGALRQALKDAHLHAVYVGGGFDALDELALGGSDIVVACVNLGDLSGYQLSALIKSTAGARQMPVVLFGAPGQTLDQQDYWARACRADGYFSAASLEGAGAAAAVEQIKKLVEESRLKGFDRRQGVAVISGRSSFTSGNMLESSGRLIDDLVLVRSAHDAARQLTQCVTRGQFVDEFLSECDAFVDCDLIGLVVSGVESWGAFKARREENVGAASYKKLVDRLAVETGIKSDVQIDLRASLRENGVSAFGSVEIVPVQRDGKRLATLVFASKESNSFSDEEIAFYHALGAEMATPLELLTMRQLVAEMQSREASRASVDPLTGLYNLEFLIGFLQQQLLFSFRQRLPVAVAIVDIDEFSKVNQEHGFEFADGALMSIANRLLHITRSSDLLARYGGDQFAVVLPNTDLAGARVLAEKVRSEVEAQLFDNAGGQPRLTVSVGYAAFNMEDLNPETILRDAKVALHQAKSQGRNRVHG